MIKSSPINFTNIRTAFVQGSMPLFFVDDIKAAYFIENDDIACEAIYEKFGRLVSDEVRVLVVSFEGLQAMVALARYRLGGDVNDLRRFDELMDA